MAAKLNTDLDKTANKKNAKGRAKDDDISALLPDDVLPVEEQQEDDLTYNMGEIIFDGDDVDEDNQILSKSSTTGNDDDDDDDKDDDGKVQWVDDEISIDDDDPFLDMEDYDPDNHVYDD